MLPGQDEEYREVQRRLTLFRVGLLLIVGLLVLRLWQLQIREGSYYRELATKNRTRTVMLEPARGLIYDRHGVLLANNVPSFSLYVTPQAVTDRSTLIKALRQLIGVDETVLTQKLSEPGSQLLPRKVKSGLTLHEVALIESHRTDLPGVTVRVETRRNYPNGILAAHVLGYVGEVSAEQLERPEYAGVHLGSVVGQSGVEKTYDRFLRGRAGHKLVEVDALGQEKRILSVEQPLAGDDLYLTIDARLQALAERLLGEESGAIVALEVATGDVLVMASRPAFDPNLLSHELSAEQWANVVQDEGRPLTNRATQGQYPPGSTFKIVVAAAALETGTVSPATKVSCPGGFLFGGRLYRDWRTQGHGVVNIVDALVNSCDVFFYTIGQRLGIDTIAAFADQFGLGHETGIELPSERSGIVPSTRWKARVRHEAWMPGETVSAAIGQGYTTVTPLQMAVVMATVAGKGEAYRPRIVRAIRERTTGAVIELPSQARPQVRLKPGTYAVLRESLEGVVTRGTGGRARSTLVSIAGKTGTAQVAALRDTRKRDEELPQKLRDHAWFVAYAPTDDPRIAVAVLVEHTGHGGTWAAPLAKQLIEAYVQAYLAPPVVADTVRNERPLIVAQRESHG